MKCFECKRVIHKIEKTKARKDADGKPIGVICPDCYALCNNKVTDPAHDEKPYRIHSCEGSPNY